MEDIHRIEPALINVAIYLSALVAGVLIFRRLGLGSALGYLLVGSIVGPAALGLVGDNHTAATLAEFGVVLLLFVIGLELRAARLWRLRIDIFGLGSAQLLLTTALFGSLLRWALDWGWGPALVTGAALSLSSTAFGVQLLEERKAVGTPFADRAISILLFQDLALVPLVAMVTLFAPAGSGVAATELDVRTITVALVSLLALVLGGYFLVNPLFRLIARSGADEAFTAGALLVVVAAALLMQFAGLSMAMGAVIAGILLADSEYRHRIESAIDPFRGLLLGMFFMGIGIGLDWRAVFESLPLILGCAIFVFAVKALIIFALARVRGSSLAEAARTGLLLGQAGEFGFVLFGLAAASGVFGVEEASVLTAIAVMSMALTPVVLKIADRRIAARRDEVDGETGLPDPGEMPQAPVLVVGFGRFGQTVAQVLSRCGHRMLLFDSNPERVRVARSLGYEAFFGSLEGKSFLHAASRQGLRAILVCIDDSEASLQAVSRLRESFPDACLLARVPDRYAQWEMLEIGADEAFREVHESALSMSKEALRLLGEGEAGEAALAEIRREDREGLEKMVARYTRSDIGERGDGTPDFDKAPVANSEAPHEPDPGARSASDPGDSPEPSPIPTRRHRPPAWRSLLGRARRMIGGRSRRFN